MKPPPKLDPEQLDNLFLLRHGESTCNTVHRIAGVSDVPLNRLGRSQAEKAGRDWDGGGFDMVFMSNLRRARQAADLVCSKMTPEPSLIIDERLAERDFGSYTLQNKAVLQRQFGVPEYEKAMNSDSDTMEDGESFVDFRRRVEDFYEDTLIPAIQSGQRVLVISHKYVIEFIARMVLGLPLSKAHDLRLPNSQFLCAANLECYLSGEVKWRNQAYDMITVNYHIVFVCAVVIGFLLHLLGLQTTVSPLILVAILAAATAVGLTTVEIEDVFDYLRRRDVLLVSFWRFGALPLTALAAVHAVDLTTSSLVMTGLAFLSAPTGVLAITASRCAGGLILPALAIVVLASLFSILPLALLLSLGSPSAVPDFILTCVLVFAVSVFLPYGLVLALRRRWPIRTAKFGSRNGHWSVLLLALYIVLAMLGIDLNSALSAGLIAAILALMIKLVTVLLVKRSQPMAVDYFCSMTYPNAFVMVVLGGLLNLPDLMHIATWYLLPMSILAAADGPFARSCAKRLDRAELQRLLQVPSYRPASSDGVSHDR